MTALGGDDNFGVIFTTNPDGSAYQVIHHFDSVNGSIPESKLVKGLNGKFYGTTLIGGIHNDGVIFEIDLNGNFRKKADLHDATLGSRIQGGLALGSNGKLYGTSWSGGATYDGTIFEYDVVNEKLTKLADFDNEGHRTGAFPFASLVLAHNGKFYGTCYAGGENTLGVIFEFDPNSGTLSKKFDFTLKTGGRPAFNMTLAADGKLYGITGDGGKHGFGTIFVFDPNTGSFETVHDFEGLDKGGLPLGTLTLAYNGKLYGTTAGGGRHNGGTLFEFDYHSQTFAKRFDFDDINTGKVPRGGLLQSANGNFYGTTEQGGVYSQGVFFEFNPNNGSFVKKRDFILASGGQAQSCELTFQRDQERTLQAIVFDPGETLSLEEPVIQLQATASSGLPVIYYSSDPEVASVSRNELTIKKMGSVSITATQPGNAEYRPAPDVLRTLRIDNAAKTDVITLVKEIPGAFDVIVKENPFKGRLRFEVNSIYRTEASFVLYTMMGQRIHESHTQTNTDVDIQMDFKPGIYLLGVQTNRSRKVLKLLCVE